MTDCVIINGVFDCLHAGHLELIGYAYKHKEYKLNQDSVLIAGIDSDKKVKQDKGYPRPYFSQEERKTHVLSTLFVDEVFFFDSNEELYEKIKFYNPKYLIKHIDWKDNVVGSDLCEVIYHTTKLPISTSKIEKRILDTWKNSFNMK